MWIPEVSRLPEQRELWSTADPFAALAVTEATLNDFRFFVQYAGASYCNSENAPGAPITCAANACADAEANGASTVAAVEGPRSGLGAVVAIDHARDVIVVSVRGSSNVRNWITNIQFAWAGCDSLTSGCKVHTGFAEAWDEIRGTVINAVRSARASNPGYRVVATGHSLGGAVATIGAAYLRAHEGVPVDVYTYGAPRSGNDVFANFVTRQAGAEFRLTHGADPVSRLPPILFGYRHTTPEYWLNGGSSDTIDYGTGNIRVCEGIANVSCNSGTFGLDVLAHGYFLANVAACNPKFKPSVRQADVSDEELEERLNNWVREDIQYVEEHS